MDWSLSSRNVVNVSWIQMVHAEDIFNLDGALSFSLSRGF
jgi:predicted phosphohydrolase